MSSEEWRKPVPPDFVAKVLINDVQGAARSRGYSAWEIPAWWMAEAIQLYYAGITNKAGFQFLIEYYFDDLAKTKQAA